MTLLKTETKSLVFDQRSGSTKPQLPIRGSMAKTQPSLTSSLLLIRDIAFQNN